MQVLTLNEIDDVSGGDLVSTVGTAALTVGGVQLGAYYGAQVGFIGGPVGAVIGGVVGAGAAYVYYNYVA